MRGRFWRNVWFCLCWPLWHALCPFVLAWVVLRDWMCACDDRWEPFMDFKAARERARR